MKKRNLLPTKMWMKLPKIVNTRKLMKKNSEKIIKKIQEE